MLNKERLKDALRKYSLVFKGRWQDEKFKWEAVKNFKEKWDITSSNFAQMFYDSTDKTYGLLASMNNFPRKMIYEYALQEPETVRAMFINLFDESKDIIERISQFQSDADDLCSRLTPGMQHYQRPMAITVYLWLRYPEQHCVFKYTVCKETCSYLQSDFSPKKGNAALNIRGNRELILAIAEAINEEEELKTLFKQEIDNSCYPDATYMTLAFDVSVYISEKLSKKSGEESEWLYNDYDPGITKEKWLELLDDREIFTPQSLEIMYRIKDYGGAATCKQLSVKYGGEPNYYNIGSSSLGRRVAEKTNCNVRTDEDGKQRWWSILYLGRNARKEEEGWSYVKI